MSRKVWRTGHTSMEIGLPVPVSSRGDNPGNAEACGGDPGELGWLRLWQCVDTELTSG